MALPFAAAGDNTAAEKAALRKSYRAARQGMSPQERALAGTEIFRRLSALEQYRSAGTVFCYVSFGEEPDTRQLIARALADGKRVACPRCSQEPGIMEFYYITSADLLVPGRFGIPEPPAEHPAGCPNGACLCVVPGLCFDVRGHRIGYGGGYYDRFLARFGGVSAGICYDAMLIDGRLPHDRLDRRVDAVVTDRRTVRCG